MHTADDLVQILLVEDNPADAEMALHGLRKHNFANKVAWVKDGVEALDYIFHRGAYEGLNGLPKVVFLDLRLPKLDGIDVLREMRAHDETKEIPVVILTSSKEERDVVETYRLGVNSYVAKPVEFKDFASTIAELGFYWVAINRVPYDDTGD